jgi:endo-1,4-beta-D-glucanase Y
MKQIKTIKNRLCRTPYWLGLLTLISANNVLAEIVVEDISFTDRTRISRSDYQYTFTVTIANTGENAQNIAASVTSANPNSDVSLSALTLDALPSSASAPMTGQLVLVQNRRVRFNPQDIVFDFTYDTNTLNEFEQTFSPTSAYITNEHPNFFVEQEMANEAEVTAKIQAHYAQFFELIDAPDPVDIEEPSLATAFFDDFSNLSEQWFAFADNGTSPSVSLSTENEKLVVSPQWNATGDAIAVKYQQFAPTDFSNGATISYLMEAAQAYTQDGNLAVQLILEDENYTPAFFAYRVLNESGELSISIDNVSPDSDFGYVGPGFDFSKVAGIGFQFLANSKPVSVGGNITIDDVKISVAPAPVADGVVFVDDMSAGISPWNVQNDNGSALDVVLFNVDETLVVAPAWQAENDAFTVKYQQFDPIDMTRPVNVSVDVSLPASYTEYNNMAIQLVVEDINYQVGFTGYGILNDRPADTPFTVNFADISPSSGYGFISDSFDYEQLAGVGFQILANGKPIDVTGNIVLDNVTITQAAETVAPPAPVSNTSVLFAAADDMAFIKAIDTGKVYSEGMSYGMMLAVMMDDKATFDKLWKFTKTYMQNQEGPQAGFFAWRLEGEAPFSRLDVNPAPDGEEYFAMSLFFAHNRWGSEESGILDYQGEANSILLDMVNLQTSSTRPMMHPVFRQIEFVNINAVESFTDPSYHLPAFYELWALWADENNRYWHEVAQVSRDFFTRASHPETGLFSDYASHEGVPQVTSFNPNSHKSAFDSHRVIGNIAMDYHWFSQSEQMRSLIDKQVLFYESENDIFGNFIAIYEVDGTREPGVNYRGEGRNAMNGYGATASDLPYSKDMLQSLWDQDIPTGTFRYYDGFLYMFSLLHASGEFKIHKPEEE